MSGNDDDDGGRDGDCCWTVSFDAVAKRDEAIWLKFCWNKIMNENDKENEIKKLIYS